RRTPLDDPGDGSAPAAPKLPTTAAGLNRFVWDLRYSGPVTFPGIVLRYASPNEGPVAAPGQYLVRLTANGITESQPITVQRDPRLTEITDADLQEQFKLAMQLRDQTSRAHEAVLKVRQWKAEVEKRVSGDRSIAREAAVAKTKLDEVESEL